MQLLIALCGWDPLNMAALALLSMVAGQPSELAAFVTSHFLRDRIQEQGDPGERAKAAILNMVSHDGCGLT